MDLPVRGERDSDPNLESDFDADQVCNPNRDPNRHRNRDGY
jgi:hypothetical protein